MKLFKGQHVRSHLNIIFEHGEIQIMTKNEGNEKWSLLYRGLIPGKWATFTLEVDHSTHPVTKHLYLYMVSLCRRNSPLFWILHMKLQVMEITWRLTAAFLWAPPDITWTSSGKCVVRMYWTPGIEIISPAILSLI